MRRIERTTQFKRDYKREARGRYKTVLESALIEVIGLLVVDPLTLSLARLGSHSELSL